MIWRVICSLMTMLLALSAGLQYNDPDPVPWAAFYGLAAVLSGIAAVVPRRYPWPLPAGLAIWGMIWAGSIAPDVVGKFEIADLFASWEMKDFVIEEARECLGLGITAAWMAVLWSARMLGRRVPASQGAAGGPGPFERLQTPPPQPPLGE